MLASRPAHFGSVVCAGRRGRIGRQGPPGPSCENPVRSSEWVCPVTKLSNGRKKPCDDYACECKATATCPMGQYVSSCLCSNTNPLTPVDLGAPLGGSDASMAGAAVPQYGAELDLRYPWVLSSSFTPMSVAGGPSPNSISECTCTWVNTIPLVSLCWGTFPAAYSSDSDTINRQHSLSSRALYIS